MSAPTVVIVDYDAGNLRSVQRALETFGARVEITSSPSRIPSADGLVVPGQGACDSSMRHLRERGLIDPLRDYISSGKPFLGYAWVFNFCWTPLMKVKSRVLA